LKRLEKVMTYDEATEYLKNHKKYTLPETSTETPFIRSMKSVDEYSFETDEYKGDDRVSKLIKYPVLLEQSAEYKEDLEAVKQENNSVVSKFLKKYNIK